MADSEPLTADDAPVYGYLQGPGNRLVLWAVPASGGHRVARWDDIDDEAIAPASWDYKSEARARARFVKEAGA